jgi:hypothetical protein
MKVERHKNLSEKGATEREAEGGGEQKNYKHALREKASNLCASITGTTLCSKSDRTKAAGVLRPTTIASSHKVIKRGRSPLVLRLQAADSSCEEIVQEWG